MKKPLLLIPILSILFFSGCTENNESKNETPKVQKQSNQKQFSFEKSKKKLINKVYFDKKRTFYCNNPYQIKQINGNQKLLLVKNKKHYTPRKLKNNDGNINQKTQKAHWAYVVPQHRFSQHLPCWKKGGKKACKENKKFKKMSADMHNIVPAIGEIKQDRGGKKFGAKKPKPGQYGQCKMEINFKKNIAFVKDAIKGDIARTYFYMANKYNFKLTDKEVNMMKSWDKKDPVSQWERTKNQRIKQIQGNGNPYIK